MKKKSVFIIALVLFAVIIAVAGIVIAAQSDSASDTHEKTEDFTIEYVKKELAKIDVYNASISISADKLTVSVDTKEFKSFDSALYFDWTISNAAASLNDNKIEQVEIIQKDGEATVADYGSRVLPKSEGLKIEYSDTISAAQLKKLDEYSNEGFSFKYEKDLLGQPVLKCEKEMNPDSNGKVYPGQIYDQLAWVGKGCKELNIPVRLVRLNLERDGELAYAAIYDPYSGEMYSKTVEGLAHYAMGPDE